MATSTVINPLKRSFEDMESKPNMVDNDDSEVKEVDLCSVKDFDPRRYHLFE